MAPTSVISPVRANELSISVAAVNDAHFGELLLLPCRRLHFSSHVSLPSQLQCLVYHLSSLDLWRAPRSSGCGPSNVACHHHVSLYVVSPLSRLYLLPP